MWISKLRIILWLAAILTVAGPSAAIGLAENLPGRPADGLSQSDTSFSARRTACLLITSPFRASTRDWIGAGAFAAAVAFTFPLDRDLRDDADGPGKPWMKTADWVGHTFQNVGVFFGTAGALYLGGVTTHRPAWQRTGTELAIAFVAAQGGTQTVKYLAGRARPNTGNASGHLVGPTLDDNYHSFWSGDVTNAFTLASVLSAEIKRPAMTVILYGLAASTAFQRIHTNHHWLSDVAAAAVWSTAVGINTVKIGNRKLKNGNSPLGVSVQLRPAELVIIW